MYLSKPQRSVYDMEKFAGGSIAVICSSILCRGTADLLSLQSVVRQLYHSNEILRTRICETSEGTEQYFAEDAVQNFDVLHFDTQADFTEYAGRFAKEPLNLYGNLCEIKIVILPENTGSL